MKTTPNGPPKKSTNPTEALFEDITAPAPATAANVVRWRARSAVASAAASCAWALPASTVARKTSAAAAPRRSETDVVTALVASETPLWAPATPSRLSIARLPSRYYLGICALQLRSILLRGRLNRIQGAHHAPRFVFTRLGQLLGAFWRFLASPRSALPPPAHGRSIA